MEAFSNNPNRKVLILAWQQLSVISLPTDAGNG